MSIYMNISINKYIKKQISCLNRFVITDLFAKLDAASYIKTLNNQYEL
ncbi:MAG: hypothetical protein EZS26_003778 [Candidatus Ordinivivax streblomastigis]|uniref:Uncharacterized protein n=1 Tax=Candidatus Ordinivivax streblomastigis TaxID=2540710 RepID=A0A5M8NXZ8_9BACT|nr:MAG: hypothetical protein EZS26_003778 [Candidatus Ordinivivax streblomastigis]